MLYIKLKTINLKKTKHERLTYEVLPTFMAEVMALMNSRLLVPVSNDVEASFILSPQMLQTQKTQKVKKVNLKTLM